MSGSDSGPDGEAATIVTGSPPLSPGSRLPVAPGANVGRYVVLEEVGRGAMGRVLRAYDPKLQREVALKEVRPELVASAHASGAGDVHARIVAEARAMAKLSHPNVVAVYDVEDLRDLDGSAQPAEEARGELVLVMEYVAGTSLDVWLRAESRGWREIVDHFIAAGRGLAAAHAVGLLHRDFKPANVLVASHGDVVKVTDFGLAKAAGGPSDSADASDERATERPELTQAGVVMGTPRYMAPEQHTGEPLTAAADQYALCVALWEGLCGAPPFRGKTIGYDKRAGPPPWPASTVPKAIADAIVRGLSLPPSERWPAVGELLEALTERPASGRKWTVVAAGLGVATIVAALWVTRAAPTDQACTGAELELGDVWGEASRAAMKTAMLSIKAAYAVPAWSRTEAALDRYAGAWAAMHTEVCTATTIRAEQSAEAMDLRMACLNRAKVGLSAVVGVLTAADAQVVRNADIVAGGVPALEHCADVEALRRAVDPPAARDAAAVEAARAALARVDAARLAGQPNAAKGAIEDAQRAAADIEYGPLLAEIALADGQILSNLGKYPESEAALDLALSIAAKSRRLDIMQHAAASLIHVVGVMQGRFDEGLRYRTLAEGLSEGEPLREALVYDNVAIVLRQQGHYDEAEAMHRRALALRIEVLGAEHRDVAASHASIASVLKEQGNYRAAEAETREALRLRERVLGAEHPNVASSRDNLAAVLFLQGRYEEAEAEHRLSFAIRVEALGADHPEVAGSQVAIAGVLYQRGKFDEAIELIARALIIKEKAFGPDNSVVATGRTNFGVVLAAAGRYAEAEFEQRRALATMLATLGDGHPSTAQPLNNLADALLKQGKYEEAEDYHRRALTLREATLPADHPYVALSRSNVAATLIRRGEHDEAVKLAELAWQRRDADDIPAQDRADTAFVLAQALWAPKRDRAQERRATALAQRALELWQAAGLPHAGRVGEVQTWLAERQRASK